MNLLPKSHEEFSQKEYWDSFFKKRGNKAFEWYGEYPELAEHLHKYIKKQDDILITGCGNSTLGRDLYDIGHEKVTNIDISQVVIRQMLSQNEKQRPNLKYLQMDALQTSFNDEAFSVVLDKGTLDALMPDNQYETLERINKYFSEIQRLLKIGGRYICISLLQEQILNILLDYFPQNNFLFRVVRCYEAEKKAIENEENAMPVFIIICTKFKALPTKILELDLISSGKMQRYDKIEVVKEQITSMQNAAFVCSSLKRTNLDQENEVSFDLYEAGSEQARFTVFIVDSRPNYKHQQYAAFIVPQGREAEWLFSTKQGRQNLIKMTKTNRLAIVTMHRGQEYGNFDQVQSELTEAIVSLAPADLKNKKIPFLSIGSDVGTRIIRHKGMSKFSGEYVIEDVQIDNDKYRRLFFMSSQFVIQSEAKLMRKGKKDDVVDLLHLTCKHHIYMSIAAHLVRQQNLAVIGLGGGGLCSFLRKFLPEMKIVGVDIDEEMLKIAQEWFALQLDDKLLNVEIKDGIEFLQECVKENRSFAGILFDVDSKDSTIGMSCPPQQFLDQAVLDNVAHIIRQSNGYFVLNLVLRDDSLRPSTVDKLKTTFTQIFSYKLEEDLNEIFICSNNTNLLSDKDVVGLLKNGANELNKFFIRNKAKSDCIQIEDYLKELKLC